MTLTDFLLARIAEDEAVARHAGDLRADFIGYDTGDRGEGWRGEAGPYDPARVLAECEAKRRLAKRYRRLVERAEKFPSLTQEQAESREWLRQTVADFAAVYADHPDYREE